MADDVNEAIRWVDIFQPIRVCLKIQPVALAQSGKSATAKFSEMCIFNGDNLCPIFKPLASGKLL